MFEYVLDTYDIQLVPCHFILVAFHVDLRSAPFGARFMTVLADAGRPPYIAPAYDVILTLGQWRTRHVTD